MVSVLAVCLVVSSNVASVMSSLTVRSSSVAVIGERVAIKCNVNGSDSVEWKYIAWNASTETNIYLGRDDIVELIKSRYKIDKRISGQRNLIIDSVDLNHAGRYKCSTVVLTKTLLVNRFDLTVLASPPNCSSNTSNAADEEIKEHGYMWLVCRIIYRPAGNMTPIFTWTEDSTKNVIVANTTTDSDNRTVPFTATSLVLVQVHNNDSCATFKCKITFQYLNNTELDAPDYEYTWNYYTTKVTYASYDKNHNYSFICTASNPLGDENKTITVSGLGKHFEAMPAALAIGGSLLVLLVITIIVSCVVHRKRQRADTSHRPDVVALQADLTSCGSDGRTDGAGAVYTEVRKPKGSDGRTDGAGAVYTEVRKPKGSDGRTDGAGAVYSEVRKPKGPSKGINDGNIGDNSRRYPQTQNRDRKNDTGADGTVYAELSGVKPPVRKAEVPKPPPGFSQVEIYASIDHCGEVPAPPRPQRK